jgi:aminopeptidase N
MPGIAFTRKRLLAFFVVALMQGCGVEGVDVRDGVSLDLARHRAATISNINYRLWFGIPPDMEQPIDGRVTIEFDLNDASQPLQLDFRESADKILSVMTNGATSEYEFRNEHIIVPASELLEGRNTVEIEFVAGDTSLNRNPDYLYTLFVPDRARTAFPLFDQPDLKSSFQLMLEVPAEWTALGNGALDRVEQLPDGRRSLTFRITEPIPTYLFSFVAGNFEREQMGGMTMLHRETDEDKVARNVTEIFRLHAAATDWLEEYTGIAYPFSKLDFALIPSFQYGGMEHVGAIQYRASSLLLDENPSDTELLGRASLIAHEVAHMWFGNLVTMEWFNDVWTKEVFANFMAAKIVNPDFPEIDHDLNFMMRHHPRAYAVDRSEGANPIRQYLGNLNEAGQMYGAIIYNKAPIMMRQLELIVGEQRFRDGMREYLSTFSYGNATWPALIAILDAKTDADLAAWSEVWVNTPGRPEFEAQWETTEGGEGAHMLLQHDASGLNRVWPQQLQLTSLGAAGSESFDIASTAEATPLPPLPGSPVQLRFGTAGIGYGLFPASLDSLGEWDRLSDVQKGSQLVNVYENVLEGSVPGIDDYFLQLMDIVASEDNQLLIDLALQQLSRTYASLLTAEQRDRYSAELERVLWNTMLAQPDASRTKVFFMAFARLASGDDEVRKMHDVWSGESEIDKLTLSENDLIEVAEILALRMPERWEEIIDRQLELTENPDSRRRLEFIRPSLSPSVDERNAFFESLAWEENRQTESWVLDALEYLHHSSRVAQSEEYILPSLELLQEIQQTGDIFFPTRWLVATLQNQQSDAAVTTVRAFLEQNPDYNAQLRMKILQAADMLFRSNAILAAANQ